MFLTRCHGVLFSPQIVSTFSSLYLGREQNLSNLSQFNTQGFHNDINPLTKHYNMQLKGKTRLWGQTKVEEGDYLFSLAS